MWGLTEGKLGGVVFTRDIFLWLEATLVYSGAISNQAQVVMAGRNTFTIDSGNSVRRGNMKVSAQRRFHNIRYVLLFPTLEICR